MLWDPALFRQGCKDVQVLIHHELQTLSKKISSFRFCILAVTWPKAQRVREPNEGVVTSKTLLTSVYLWPWNYVAKLFSEQRLRGQFGLSSSVENSLGSMICAVCILALTEVLPKCVILHTVAFTKNRWFWLILRDLCPCNVGICARAHRSSFPTTTTTFADCWVQGQPQAPTWWCITIHVTRNFNFFHHTAMTEAAMSCCQLFIRRCSHGTQPSRPLWLNWWWGQKPSNSSVWTCWQWEQ